MKPGKLSTRNLAEIAALICTLLLLALLIPQMITAGNPHVSEKVIPLEGWYILTDGKRTDVTLPASIKSDASGNVVLYNDSLREQDAGLAIATNAASFYLRICMGDTVLHEYSESLFPRNDQMRGKLVCTASVPIGAEGQTLRLEYKMAPGEIDLIPQVYIGSSAELLKQVFAGSTPMLIIVFAMMFASALAMAVGLYMGWLKIPDFRFVEIALFFLLCAVWVLTDSGLIAFYSNQDALISTVSFFAFMTMSIPMVHFIKDTGEMKKYRILDVCIFLLYANAICQIALCALHVCSLVDMLFVTHILLVFGVACCVGALAAEHRANPGRGVNTVLVAFAMLGGSGILALVLYWLLKITYYDMIFEVGILLFGILILNETVYTVVCNFRDRMELTLLQRFAREDQLTGLGNRRAFDEHLNDSWDMLRSCENAALIYADVNHLKKTNDLYGHNVGDEMIIAAARCIEKAYGSFGRCYRIGGDEFCIIIPEATESEAELCARLDRAVSEFDTQGRFDLSVARGMSFLHCSDGSVKQMDDWLIEADKKMYQNKGGSRRT